VGKEIEKEAEEWVKAKMTRYYEWSALERKSHEGSAVEGYVAGYLAARLKYEIKSDSLDAVTSSTGGRMTPTITISAEGDRVTSVYFDKRLSDEDAAEVEQLLMREERFDPIWDFLKAKWPESEIKVKRTYGTVIVGDYKCTAMIGGAS